jgi:hypothetical protein
VSRAFHGAATLATLAAGLSLPTLLRAQAEGAIAGRVRDSATSVSLSQAQVLVDDRLRAVTDTGGLYRIRGVRSGWHRVTARLIGYRSVVQDSVFIRAGATVTLVFKINRMTRPDTIGIGAVYSVGLFAVTFLVTWLQFTILERRVHYAN